MKAIALISGGLDSVLAAKIVKEQGIFVVGLHVKIPFVAEKKEYAHLSASQIGIPLLTVHAGEEFLRIVRNPRFGYGSALNPCIDCRIFMLRKAKEIAERINASFVVTGEVLNERPMSQHRTALRLVERESGLEGLVLRPLSAKLLPATIPEREGWVERRKMLAIRGRSRKIQLALARKFGISLENVASPAGGCLLTYKEFAAKLRDLFEHNAEVTLRDVERLKVGRHFRFKRFKIIVGRNEEENKRLLSLRKSSDFVLEVRGFGSPVTILEVPAEVEAGATKEIEEAVEVAARLTARYSDAKDREEVVVSVRRDTESEKRVRVPPAREEEISRLRVQAV